MLEELWGGRGASSTRRGRRVSPVFSCRCDALDTVSEHACGGCSPPSVLRLLSAWIRCEWRPAGEALSFTFGFAQSSLACARRRPARPTFSPNALRLPPLPFSLRLHFSRKFRARAISARGSYQATRKKRYACCCLRCGYSPIGALLTLYAVYGPRRLLIRPHLWASLS